MKRVQIVHEGFHRLVRLILRTVACRAVNQVSVVDVGNHGVDVNILDEDLPCFDDAHAVRHIIKSIFRNFRLVDVFEAAPLTDGFLDVLHEGFVDVWREVIVKGVDALATQQLFPAARLYLHLRCSKRRRFIFERRINSRPTLLAYYQLTSDRLEPLCGWLAFDSLLTCFHGD